MTTISIKKEKRLQNRRNRHSKTFRRKSNFHNHKAKRPVFYEKSLTNSVSKSNKKGIKKLLSGVIPILIVPVLILLLSLMTPLCSYVVSKFNKLELSYGDPLEVSISIVMLILMTVVIFRHK